MKTQFTFKKISLNWLMTAAFMLASCNAVVWSNETHC